MTSPVVFWIKDWVTFAVGVIFGFLLVWFNILVLVWYSDKTDKRYMEYQKWLKRSKK